MLYRFPPLGHFQYDNLKGDIMPSRGMKCAHTFYTIMFHSPKWYDPLKSSVTEDTLMAETVLALKFAVELAHYSPHILSNFN